MCGSRGHRWAQRRTHEIVFFRESELTAHESGISLQYETEGLKRRTDSILEVRRRRAQVMLDRFEALLNLLRFGRPHGHLRERHESPTPVPNVSNRLGEFRIEGRT